MSLPPMPEESFFDGGDPQSKKSPGDPERELIHEVKNLSQGVTLLSRAVKHVAATTVPRPEVDLRRRGAVLMLLLAIFAVVWIHDAHIEQCSPGARVTRALDYLLANPPTPTQTEEQRQEAFERVYNASPTLCEVTFPLHTHDGVQWPHGGNLLGLALYAALWLTILGWWASAWLTARPRPQPDTGPGVVRLAALVSRPFQQFEAWIRRAKNS